MQTDPTLLANNTQHCWAKQCCDLLRPFAWNYNSVGTCWHLLTHANGRNIVCQQHPTLLGVVGTCYVRLHGPLHVAILTRLIRIFTREKGLCFFSSTNRCIVIQIKSLRKHP